MTNTKKINWRDVQLWNIDSGPIEDTEKRFKLLAEYKNTGCMHQCWLADPGECLTGDDADQVYDEFHQEIRAIWNAGPGVDEIDWTGFKAD